MLEDQIKDEGSKDISGSMVGTPIVAENYSLRDRLMNIPYILRETFLHPLENSTIYYQPNTGKYEIVREKGSF